MGIGAIACKEGPSYGCRVLGKWLEFVECVWVPRLSDEDYMLVVRQRDNVWSRFGILLVDKESKASVMLRNKGWVI